MPLQGIGRSLPPIETDCAGMEVVAVEKNLASLGYFTPSNKRVRSPTHEDGLVYKELMGQEQAKATIVPGHPLAFQQQQIRINISRYKKSSWIPRNLTARSVIQSASPLPNCWTCSASAGIAAGIMSISMNGSTS